MNRLQSLRDVNIRLFKALSMRQSNFEKIFEIVPCAMDFE